MTTDVRRIQEQRAMIERLRRERVAEERSARGASNTSQTSSGQRRVADLDRAIRRAVEDLRTLERG